MQSRLLHQAALSMLQDVLAKEERQVWLSLRKAPTKFLLVRNLLRPGRGAKLRTMNTRML